MESRMSKVEVTVNHIETDVGEIKAIMKTTAEQLQELSHNVGTLAHMYDEMEKIRIRTHDLSQSVQSVSMAQKLAQRCEKRLDSLEHDFNEQSLHVESVSVKIDSYIERSKSNEVSINSITLDLSKLDVTNKIMFKGLVTIVFLITAQVAAKFVGVL